MQPQPILMGVPILGLRSSRSGVSLFPHVVIALRLTVSSHLPRWLEHGNVSDLYAVVKVQPRNSGRMPSPPPSHE